MKTWEHRVPLPDTVNMERPEDDPDVIVVWSETEGTEPEPPDVCDSARQVAWRAMGIPRNPDAALTKYAREKGLGAPLTTEFDFQHGGTAYRGQGYALGIVFCEAGRWDTVWVALW